MRILQAMVNKAELGRLFVSEPRPYAPVVPTAQETAVRAALRLDRDDVEASEVLRGLAYALRAAAHRLEGLVRDEIRRIPPAFLQQAVPGVAGAVHVSGSLRGIHGLYASGWPLHGPVDLSPSNPYAPIKPASFVLSAKARACTALVRASADGTILRVALGGEEPAVLELPASLAPSTHVRIFAPQAFPHSEVLALLHRSAALGTLLSASGMAGLYESLPDAEGRVAVVAASLAKRGLNGQPT